MTSTPSGPTPPGRDEPAGGGSERRRASRHGLRQWIELVQLDDAGKPAEHIAAAAVNVSMSGLRVMLARAPRAGSRAVVMLRPAGDRRPILRHAVVRNLVDGHDGWSLAGLEFVSAPPELASVPWGEWVRRVARATGGAAA